MPAYVIVEVEITDPAAYEGYKAAAAASIAGFGGRYLARGGAADMLEGTRPLPGRVVILEFESRQRAQQWYASPEYSVARAARAGAAQMHMLLVDGLPPA